MPTRLGRLPRPVRQPMNPPEYLEEQHHAGFIRFLKQHASPSHHRVTAGGRIVPNGPSSPPPMFDYASLTGIVEPQPHTLRGNYGTRRYQQNRVFNVPGQQPFAGNAMPYFVQPTPTPQVLPMGQLSDGTPIVSCGGVCYRAVWDADKLLLEPLQVKLVSTSPAPEVRGSGQNLRFPFVTNNTDHADRSGDPTAWKKRDPSQSHQPETSAVDEQHCRDELAQINSHLAFYHYQLRPTERARLIARRRDLTEEIDRLRVPRALTVSMPYRSSSNRHTTDTEPEVKSSLVKKALSPNAPAFVPGSWAAAARPDENIPRQASHHVTSDSKTPQRQVSMDYSEDDLLQYTPPDTLDPAMRMVHQDDIAYTAGYETTGMSKDFCTTLPQFQEAIRRVRQQARLYGCEGGSSKDPAYDAEQDIWWAIKDGSPIPLPGDTPDHVAFPRPWNWNDSAFNRLVEQHTQARKPEPGRQSIGNDLGHDEHVPSDHGFDFSQHAHPTGVGTKYASNRLLVRSQQGNAQHPAHSFYSPNITGDHGPPLSTAHDRQRRVLTLPHQGRALSFASTQTMQHHMPSDEMLRSNLAAIEVFPKATGRYGPGSQAQHFTFSDSMDGRTVSKKAEEPHSFTPTATKSLPVKEMREVTVENADKSAHPSRVPDHVSPAK